MPKNPVPELATISYISLNALLVYNGFLPTVGKPDTSIIYGLHYDTDEYGAPLHVHVAARGKVTRRCEKPILIRLTGTEKMRLADIVVNYYPYYHKNSVIESFYTSFYHRKFNPDLVVYRSPLVLVEASERYRIINPFALDTKPFY
jgi:hypothetical protein